MLLGTAVGRVILASGDLTPLESVCQNLSHNVRQRLIGQIGDLDPSCTLWRGGRTSNACDEDGQLEWEMSEHVTHRARQRAPSHSSTQSWRQTASTGFDEIMRPLAPRHFHHRGEQALFGAATQQHATVGAQRYECRSPAQIAFRFSELAWKRFLIAACVRTTVILPRAQYARGTLRRTDGRSEIHERLSEVARPMSRQQRCSTCSDRRLRSRQFFFNKEKPRDDTLDISVDRYRRKIESNRRNRRRRVVADPRQAAQGINIAREVPAMVRDDSFRTGMQIASARVVAEPRPSTKNIIEARRSKRGNCRPTR